MPIYEYQCKQCGKHFEKRQSVSDEPLKTCEECDGALEKQWSLSGFQFKGDGWYVTDYAGKNGVAGDAAGGTKAASGDGGEKSSAGESTAASDAASKPKSEATPAAKKSDGGSSKP
jgi:putative FmdB family regulatory protein